MKKERNRRWKDKGRRLCTTTRRNVPTVHVVLVAAPARCVKGFLSAHFDGRLGKPLSILLE
jgi:hypothetical protein